MRDEVANEAHVEISAAEIAALQRRGESGDRAAISRLANYYAVNFGDQNEDAIYWQLHAARAGDCREWEDLMFMETEDGSPVPIKLFKTGETLRSIGEASKCPPYKPVKKPAP